MLISLLHVRNLAITLLFSIHTYSSLTTSPTTFAPVLWPQNPLQSVLTNLQLPSIHFQHHPANQLYFLLFLSFPTHPPLDYSISRPTRLKSVKRESSPSLHYASKEICCLSAALCAVRIERTAWFLNSGRHFILCLEFQRRCCLRCIRQVASDIWNHTSTAQRLENRNPTKSPRPANFTQA